MSGPQIQHYRNNCIGCNACVQHAPQTWFMSPKDGKAVLKNARGKSNVFISDLADENVAANQKAAQSCPTRVIKILNT